MIIHRLAAACYCFDDLKAHKGQLAFLQDWFGGRTSWAAMPPTIAHVGQNSEKADPASSLDPICLVIRHINSDMSVLNPFIIQAMSGNGIFIT